MSRGERGGEGRCLGGGGGGRRRFGGHLLMVLLRMTTMMMLLMWSSTAATIRSRTRRREGEGRRSTLEPASFASAFSSTLKFVVNIPDQFCAKMKTAKDHVGMIEKIRSFFVKPDTTPDEYAECRAMREIQEHLPRVRKEAEDVLRSDCPFDDDGEGAEAQEEWTVEMRDLCRFMSSERGSTATHSIHDELTRGICGDDDSGIQKVIADISFGLCWRVIDNMNNDRAFACPFFEEAQFYIESALKTMNTMSEQNTKRYRDLYCDYVLWSYESAQTVDLGERPNDVSRGPKDGEYVTRVGQRAFDLGLRKNDRIVAIIEPNENEPVTSLGRMVFGSGQRAAPRRRAIRKHGDVNAYLNEQKTRAVAHADEFSRQTARDLWRNWQVTVVVRSSLEEGDVDVANVPLEVFETRAFRGSRAVPDGDIEVDDDFPGE